MATSIENAKWLSGQGLAGLWQSYRTQEVHGPLGPLAATPLQLLAGPSEMAAWVTVVGFGAAGTLAVFALARSVVGRWWAVLATIVAATTPIFIDWSRIAYVVLPSGVLLLLCAAAVARSDGMRRTSFAVAAGGLAGATILCRPMTAALIPGLFLVPTISAIAVPSDRLRRLRNLAIGIAVGAAVTATWLVGNLDRLIAYLLHGKDVENFGGGEGSPGLSQGDIIPIVDSMWLPLTLVVFVLLTAGLVLWLHSVRDSGKFIQIINAPIFAIVAPVVWTTAVLLLAPRAHGSGIYYVPMLIVLTIAVAARLPKLAHRRLVASALILVAGITVVAKSGLTPALPAKVIVETPRFSIVVLDGRSWVQQDLDGHGVTMTGLPGQRLPPSRSEEWVEFINRVTHDLVNFMALDRRVPVVLLSPTSPDSFFHPWALRLADRLHIGSGMIVGQLVAPGIPYEQQLTLPEFGFPSFLLDFPTIRQSAPSGPEPPAMAAAKVGFKPVKQYTMPDGRPLTVWWIPGRGPLVTDRPDPY